MSFAFAVSLVDMIRKLRYRYEHPIDYIDVFMGRLSEGESPIELQIAQDIRIECDHMIPPSFFREVSANILSMAEIIPPVTQYRTVTVQTGTHELKVDQARTITIGETGWMPGTVIAIARESATDGELGRFVSYYQYSDLPITLNGSPVSHGSVGQFHFFREDMHGSIYYDPCTRGEIRYLKNGRFIAVQQAPAGININLYRHPLPSTLTNSRVITTGKAAADYSRLQLTLPELVLEYLGSAQAMTIEAATIQSYQALLRSALNYYPSHQGIRDFARERIRFADTIGTYDTACSFNYLSAHRDRTLPADEERLFRLLGGLTAQVTIDLPSLSNDADGICAELSSLLLCPITPTDETVRPYLSENILHVPRAYLTGMESHTLAASLIPLIEQDPQHQLGLFANVLSKYHRAEF